MEIEEPEPELEEEPGDVPIARARRVPWRRDEVREAPVRGEPEPVAERPEAPAAAPPRREPVPAAGPVASAPSAPPAPAQAVPAARGSQWNVWELERATQGDPSPDSERAYERTVLLMFLRDYASSDGQLPPEFDELVRDAFSELLAAR
jgi:hypothetical protein